MLSFGFHVIHVVNGLFTLSYRNSLSFGFHILSSGFHVIHVAKRLLTVIITLVQG